MLKFSAANNKLIKLQRKLKRKVYSLDILSGYTCPFANECKSKAVMIGKKMKIQDGPNTEFRCFSASQEVLFPNVYRLRKHNTDLLQSFGNDTEKIAALIHSDLPKDLEVCRIHVAGDFYNRAYFNAWLLVAELNPSRLFYAYTKSLSYWADRRFDIPSNMLLTASFGGLNDSLIDTFGFRYAKVVTSAYQARKLKLPIDGDDSNAAKHGGSFALLVHGVQPKGSKYGKAVKRLKGKGSYGILKK